MALLRNVCEAVRPLADERPSAPLVHPRQIRPDEMPALTMEACSSHPVRQMQPLRWEDAAAMIDHLRQEGIVVFRMSFLPPALTGRMVDFLCGAALVLHAGLYRVGQTYLLTPRGVQVDEPFLRQLEDAGMLTRDRQTRQQRLA